MSEKLLQGFAFITAIIFVITIWALSIQFIGVDNTSKATIIGGVLSMIGGMVGAFSAYFIARMQLTKQLDLQDEKDRARIIMKMKIDKADELLSILHSNMHLLHQLHGSVMVLQIDFERFLDQKKSVSKEAMVNFDDLRNNAIMEDIQKYRDVFLRDINKFPSYSAYYPVLISRVISDHERFKNYTWEITNCMREFIGGIGKRLRHEELISILDKKFYFINSEYMEIEKIITSQIQEFEKEIRNNISVFSK